MATVRPGAIHLLNGSTTPSSTTSRWWRSSASRARSSLGANYQQEVDLRPLFKDVALRVRAGLHDARAGTPPDRPRVRVALASRSVTCVIFPNDVQESPYSSRRASTARSSSAGLRGPEGRAARAGSARRRRPAERGLEAGDPDRRRRAGRRRRVVEVAERLGAGVAKALNGRAALPDTLPFVTGRSACSAPSRPTT
jgi:pyruvate dehydrogenase (quinone)